MYYFIMKIPNKPEIQQIAFNHLSDIDLKDSQKVLQKSLPKDYCKTIFFIDAILASVNLSRFRKNILEEI